ncbi:hypothetical protein J2X32_001398 [Rheinheimera pacifica]|uniref:hypothetical protein n=1 Tax=Rheinheimera pacifica TaxID=173990 RepID=UPI002854760F|nr:hypothetical protein [Rheinheimera pacifica]MDR6982780.1 hypothetical protein [Rheinheimera pacifica]
MSNIISLIERLGADCTLRSHKKDMLLSDIELLNTLADGDVKALEKLLGVENTIVCAVFPAEEEPKKSDEPDESDEPESQILNVAAN